MRREQDVPVEQNDQQGRRIITIGGSGQINPTGTIYNTGTITINGNPNIGYSHHHFTIGVAELIRQPKVARHDLLHYTDLPEATEPPQPKVAPQAAQTEPEEDAFKSLTPFKRAVALQRKQQEAEQAAAAQDNSGDLRLRNAAG